MPPISNPSIESGPAGVQDLIAYRWSPREFLEKPVEPEKLRRLFEAARWAASCFNEQPWRFVTATRADREQFGRVLSLLVEKNQQWAQSAYLIGFSASRKDFTHNGTPNRFHSHDTGAASATLALEAAGLGLQAHFMGGFDNKRARSEFAVPEEFEIGAAFALGYVDEAKARLAVRSRKAVNEVVFGTQWGQAANFGA